MSDFETPVTGSPGSYAVVVSAFDAAINDAITSALSAETAARTTAIAAEAAARTTAIATEAAARTTAIAEKADRDDPDLTGNVTLDSSVRIATTDDCAFTVTDQDGFQVFRAGDGGIEATRLTVSGAIIEPSDVVDGIVSVDPDGFVIDSYASAGGDGFAIGSAAAVAPTDRLTMVMMTGQSWTVSNGSNGRILNAAEYPDRVLTLNDARGVTGYNGTTGAPSASLVAAFDANSAEQAPMSAMAYRMAEMAEVEGRATLFFARCEGQDGVEIERLYRSTMSGATGGACWDNFMRAVTAAHSFAASAGIDASLPVIGFIHGAGNNGDSYSAYRAKLEYLIDETNAAVMAITGQRQRPTWLILQPPSGTTSGNQGHLQAQVDVCADRPDCVLVGAGWGMEQHDGIHFTAEAAVEAGELFGICAEAAIRGMDWSAPYLVNPRISGAVVTLDVAGAHDVVVDHSIATDRHQVAGSWVASEGFETWSSALAKSFPIDSVVVGRRQITVTLASAPTGPWQLRYAQHATARGDGKSTNRGTIRADWQQPSMLVPGNTLRRWLASASFNFS